MGAPDRIVVWKPQPGPQTKLLTCPETISEVFYGGARGGGKTDGVLGRFIGRAHRYGENASGIMLRRERTQLIDTIERARQLYIPLGCTFEAHPPRFRFPNGARLLMAYLERDTDAEAYQGHSYTDVCVEELGNFPNAAPVKKMMATLRSAQGVPTQFIATGNPGGPGHQWVRARYIDPAPLGYEVITDPDTGLTRVYIPARVGDNQALLSADPQYVARLKASGSPELVRAWLDGDWTVIAGAFFPEFTLQRHVRKAFQIPAHWTRFRAMDWGSARPFCVLWFAVSDGSLSGVPRGALVCYREWYGSTGEPNVGLKMTAEEVAREILARERGDTIVYGVIDPAAFNSDGGPSIAERMRGLGCHWDRADNARVARVGAQGGWDQVRARLKDDALILFDCCKDLIRTLPALQHDPNKLEDVDTDAEDHAPDTLRYGCMSRPWVQDAPTNTPIRFPTAMTINEIIQHHARRERE